LKIWIDFLKPLSPNNKVGIKIVNIFDIFVEPFNLN